MAHRCLLNLLINTAVLCGVPYVCKKLQADLREIFREGRTQPNLKVIRFWFCCHLANTMEKIDTASSPKIGGKCFYILVQNLPACLADQRATLLNGNSNDSGSIC